MGLTHDMIMEVRTQGPELRQLQKQYRFLTTMMASQEMFTAGDCILRAELNRVEEEIMAISHEFHECLVHGWDKYPEFMEMIREVDSEDSEGGNDQSERSE